ncbi:protein kinase [Nocardiopsis sediminis]|uniref:Protein kinase n=1 Tax=Nocardiopsis sediminis TaxID=1778267 RepID=A0ABV8FPW2_9ACTN
MTTDGARLAPLVLDDPVEIGAFRLIGRLGAGGMGVVYFARDASGYPAAVKTVRAEYAADPGYRARFAREVDLAKRVHGRCIAPLLAAGPDDERPWLAVSYVPGPTLGSYLAEHGPLRGGDLTAFAAGMAEALAAIHREGIVHRDLKPENVILSPEGPKVLDFGIAQALDEVSMTRMDVVVGTPGWISPERYDGHRAGPASDMFCWGGLVSMAASGRPPFGTGPVEVLRYRTVNEEADTAEDHLPEALHAVVARALHRDPAERPDADAAFAAITGEAVDSAAPAAQEHMTRVATRVIDDAWSVPVADTGAALPAEPVRATSARRPITFAGMSVHEPRELAVLFREHSARAEQWLRSDGAGKLRDWLDDIGDTVYDRDYLRSLGSAEQAGVALTAFAAGYLRDEVPLYRGREVSAEGLRRLAAGGPGDHQLLSEIILNEIPLIAAAHRCGHPGCAQRCARLENIGLRTRPVVDAALSTAAGLGLRPPPAERDRAVAAAIEVVDEPARGPAVQAVLRVWSAAAVPWWRQVALRALRADPGTEQGRSDLVLARLAAPYAHAAAPAWRRRALSPGNWLGSGALRVFVLSFLLWIAGATAWAGILHLGELPQPTHPAHPDASEYGTLLAHQAVVWPVFLLMAFGLAALPARRRAGAVLAGSAIALIYGTMAPLLPGLPILLPGFIVGPMVDAVTGMGETGWAPLLIAGLAVPVLFIWLLVALPRDRAPRIAPPLLAGSGTLARTAAAIVGIGLAVWLPLWSLTLVAAALNEFGAEATGTADEVREVFSMLSMAALPAALAYGAVAYLLWRPMGGHLIYIGVIGELMLMPGLESAFTSAGISGLGGISEWLALEHPVAATWIGLLLVPGSYAFAAWLCERLAYRRVRTTAMVAPAAYPGYGHPTPMPPHATPYPGPVAGMPPHATPYPGHVAGPQATPYPGPPAPVPGAWTPPPPGYPVPGHPVPGHPTGGAAPQGPGLPPTRIQPDPTRVQAPPTRADPDATRLGVDRTRIQPDATSAGTGTDPTRAQPPADAGPTVVRPPSADDTATRIVPPQPGADAPTQITPGSDTPPQG